MNMQYLARCAHVASVRTTEIAGTSWYPIFLSGFCLPFQLEQSGTVKPFMPTTGTSHIVTPAYSTGLLLSATYIWGVHNT